MCTYFIQCISGDIVFAHEGGSYRTVEDAELWTNSEFVFRTKNSYGGQNGARSIRGRNEKFVQSFNPNI